MALVAPLVLAAGRGRRFGGRKLAADLAGHPVLWHTLRPLAALRSRGLLAGGVVIVPAGDALLADLATEAGLEPVPNPEPELGMSASLRLGLDTLARRDPPPAAALVVLGDQPLLRTDVIERLVAEHLKPGTPVVRPVYAGDPDRPGHPVVIGRDLWPLARQVGGDSGLAHVLRLHAHLVTELVVSGENPDIDGSADLDRVRGHRP